MADKKNSKNSKSKEQSPACSIPQTPQTNQETSQSPLTSNVYSAAHQTLYWTYPGYPFTPFQPPAPHTTPANMMQSHHQQLPPAMMSTMPLLTPSPYQYTNPDLNKFMSEVTERLKKLDMLEDILKRVVSMETHCMKIDCEVSNMKEQIKTHTNTIMNIDQGLSEMSNRVQNMDEQNYFLFEENRQLKEKVIEQQSRSMRENLIFKGVPDDYNPEEDTEAILKDFIKSEIQHVQIEEEINFHVVYRLKPKQDKSPRGLLAKFERRKDRNMVLCAAIQKLKNKKQFVVHKQYPIEVIERRRELLVVPILKDARTKGHTADLKEDRLFIDNKRYYPRTTRQHPPPSAAMDQNESKLDNLDVLDVPKGYTYVTKNRKKMCKKSGGIAVIFKKSLETSLTFLSSESQFVQWMKVAKSIFGLQNDVIVGCIYIPPEGSKYSNLEAFDEIENELMSLKKVSDVHTALIGDFNAKTGILNDFVLADETLLDLFHLDTDNEIISYMLDDENLKSYNIPLQRVTQRSCQPNTYGYKLLNCYKILNMYIANSRIGVDKGVGKTTCKSTSVVDYLLLSSKLFTLVKEFEIQQFDPLLSDVHSAIHITLQSQSTSHKNNSVTSDQTPKTRWHDNKRNQFVNTVHNKKEQLSAILNDLHILHSSDHCTQHEIDKVVDSIGEILVSSANETFVKNPRTTTQRTNQKPWYTKQFLPSKPEVIEFLNRSLTSKPVITEGYNVTIVCSGDVGRPPAKFTFQKYRRDHILPMNITPTSTSVQELSENCSYYRESAFTFMVTSMDNQAVIQCNVVSSLTEENMHVELGPLEVNCELTVCI
ncbi:unnamed protein product [Mytilus edulis]|uniref:Endonuclease/exonuclease/phosphatase domain-containing protein n=1 Tax=Mytilus edulis TaxID=6550 RepID=A0A8S3R4S6_MYTED|nr:unnamed protein product [Mytilus edulis]